VAPSTAKSSILKLCLSDIRDATRGGDEGLFEIEIKEKQQLKLQKQQEQQKKEQG
jgi:hypothetical protein